ESDEQAEADSRELGWFLHRTRHPNFGHAPGFEAPEVLTRAFAPAHSGPGSLGEQRLAVRPGRANIETLHAGGGLIAGSPATMIKKITYLYERFGIGHLILLGRSGFMPTQKVRRSLELFAREVYPAICDLGASRPGTAEGATSEVGQPLRVLA